jgi:hypothetical protein
MSLEIISSMIIVTDGYTLTARKESQMPAYDQGDFIFNSLKLAETF